MKLVRESISFERSKNPYQSIGIGRSVKYKDKLEEYQKLYKIDVHSKYQLVFDLPEAEEVLDYFIVYKTVLRTTIYYFIENGDHKFVRTEISDYDDVNGNKIREKPTIYAYSTSAGSIKKFWGNQHQGQDITKHSLNNLVFNDIETATKIIMDHYLKSRSRMK